MQCKRPASADQKQRTETKVLPRDNLPSPDLIQRNSHYKQKQYSEIINIRADEGAYGSNDETGKMRHALYPKTAGAPDS